MAFSLATIFPLFSSIADTPTPDIGASDSTANCDSGVLHSTTGPTAFQAEWAANTININWYNDADAQSPISLTNSAAGTCTYDGAITLPTNTLSKTGYTFAGWQVRPALSACVTELYASTLVELDWMETGNFSSSLPRAYKNFNADAWVAPGNSERAEAFGVTSLGEWAIQMPDGGIVKGVASCNSQAPGSEYYPAYARMGNVSSLEEMVAAMEDYKDLYNPGMALRQPTNAFTASVTGKYCWCKITGFTPNDGEFCSVESDWFYGTMNPEDEHESTEECSNECTRDCTYSLDSGSPTIRAGVMQTVLR